MASLFIYGFAMGAITYLLANLVWAYLALAIDIAIFYTLAAWHPLPDANILFDKIKSMVSRLGSALSMIARTLYFLATYIPILLWQRIRDGYDVITTQIEGNNWVAKVLILTGMAFVLTVNGFAYMLIQSVFAIATMMSFTFQAVFFLTVLGPWRTIDWAIDSLSLVKAHIEGKPPAVKLCIIIGLAYALPFVALARVVSKLVFVLDGVWCRYQDLVGESQATGNGHTLEEDSGDIQVEDDGEKSITDETIKDEIKYVEDVRRTSAPVAAGHRRKYSTGSNATITDH